MSQSDTQRAREFYAQTYDLSVSDWPGEIPFYLELAQKARDDGHSVLELACGTGRVTARLAQSGVSVVGLDLSPAMLDVAREKGAGLTNVRWVQGDMRAFDLQQTFGLALVPGHSFQNVVTASDQVACLKAIRLHLVPGGVLCLHLDHQDIDWLGDLWRDGGGVFEEAESFVHPQTGRQVRARRAWSYERATQTAVVQTVWEEMGAGGRIGDRWDTGPVRLHCVFPFEMQHLLALTGFSVQAVYGSFFGEAFTDESTEMIWVARNG